MRSDWPIKWKLTGGILAATGLVMLINASAFFGYELYTFRQEMVSNLTTLGQVIAINSSAALAFDNQDDAMRVLAALSAEPHVTAAAIYRDGEVFATHPRGRQDFPAMPSDGHAFSLTSLVIVQPVQGLSDRRAGTLYLRSDLGALYSRIYLYLALMFSVTLIAAFIAVAFSRYIQRNVTTPIVSLVTAVTRVSDEHDYSVRVPHRTDDEFGRLNEAVNDMLARIEDFNASLERKVAERTLELEKVNKALDAYSYTVAHDLRAPLRHIQGFGAMLKRTTVTDDTLSPTATKYLNTILTASADMGRLVDDLLAFSRIGRTEMKRASFSMDDLVAEVIATLDVAPDQHVTWNIAALPMVVGDRALYKQVIVNLLSNAVKYSRNRAESIIDVGVAGEDDGKPIVFVRDNGAGFDPQYADKLFGVFQRLHRADEFEGSGIGLAIVRQVITRHGGHVWAEGKVGEGAMFSFSVERPEEAKAA